VIDADRDAVEAAGITVLTILGMKELISATDACAPNHDDATISRIVTGDTEGIFQLSSIGMQRLLRYARPQNLTHLTALAAVYRIIGKLILDRKRETTVRRGMLSRSPR
jgi:hypothetical protein